MRAQKSRGGEAPAVKRSADSRRLFDAGDGEIGRVLDRVLERNLALLARLQVCLLYTSDAADDLLCVDLGGGRIIQKKN